MEKFFSGIIDTDEQFIAVVVDTSEQFIVSVNVLPSVGNIADETAQAFKVLARACLFPPSQCLYSPFSADLA